MFGITLPKEETILSILAVLSWRSATRAPSGGSGSKRDPEHLNEKILQHPRVPGHEAGLGVGNFADRNGRLPTQSLHALTGFEELIGRFAREVQRNPPRLVPWVYPNSLLMRRSGGRQPPTRRSGGWDLV